jgi:hypothetical protein
MTPAITPRQTNHPTAQTCPTTYHPEPNQLIPMNSPTPKPIVRPDRATSRAAARRPVRLIDCPAAGGRVAKHLPEANSLVPLDSVAETPHTPTSRSTSRSIMMRPERMTA